MNKVDTNVRDLTRMSQAIYLATDADVAADVARIAQESHILLKDLEQALHDAINAPKGIIPVSAEKFYNAEYYT